MDVSMPVKGGLIASEEIRAIERAEGLAPSIIVALTAHAMPEDRTRCEAAGMDGFLTKPVSKKDLINILEDTAERLRRRREAETEAAESAPRRQQGAV
jgi:osomolarity two-component system sensor histidine kinase NIK1